MDTLRGSLTPHATMRGVLGGRDRINGLLREGGGGTSNYEELENLPAFNGITVEGDHDGHYYGFANLSDIPDCNYSTNEVNTGVTWIDGKNIYKKVYHYNSLNSAPNDWTLLFTDSTIDTLIKYEYIADKGDGIKQISQMYVSMSKYGNDVRYYAVLGSGTMSVDFTLYYTKN